MSSFDQSPYALQFNTCSHEFLPVYLKDRVAIHTRWRYVPHVCLENAWASTYRRAQSRCRRMALSR